VINKNIIFSNKRTQVITFFIKGQMPIFPSKMQTPSALYLGLASKTKNMILPIELLFCTILFGSGFDGSL
jgi:hypothetical protein